MNHILRGTEKKPCLACSENLMCIFSLEDRSNETVIAQYCYTLPDLIQAAPGRLQQPEYHDGPVTTFSLQLHSRWLFRNLLVTSLHFSEDLLIVIQPISTC